jgi:general secretion pathway protein A
MYTKFYGFADEPFAAEPDPKFYYLTDHHRDVLKSVVKELTEGKGLILLTEKEGSGKTAFIQKLLQTIAPAIEAVFISKPPESSEKLLEVMLRGLGLPLLERSKSAMGRQFINYITKRAARNEKIAIIVDNAQEMSKEILEELDGLANPRLGRLQAVFVGRPDFEAKLGSADLRWFNKENAVRSHLKPLTEEESRRYIERRVNKAGGNTSQAFTPDALSLIWRYSEGVPGAINQFCTQALWAGYKFSQKPVESSLVREVLEGSGMVLPEKPSRTPTDAGAKPQPPAQRVKRTTLAAGTLRLPEYLYREFYGFARNPFDPRPDPRFFFATQNYKEVWNSIMDGVARRKGFILLTGESGLGKTTLLALVSVYLSTRGQNTVIPLFHSSDDMKDILQKVLRNLGSPAGEESKSAMLFKINGDLTGKTSPEQPITIIIDDVQNLNRETLEDIRILTNYNPKRPRFVQVIFGGDPQFEKELSARDLLVLNQRVEVRSRLLPYTPEESRLFIEHRLKTAGNSTSRIFATGAIDSIISHSQGVPRTLNQICHEALLVGYSQKKRRVEPVDVHSALVNLGLEKREKWRVPRKPLSWIKKSLVRS